MSAADNYIYDDTLYNEVIEKPFTSKEMQIVYDSNNGVYNNQILFSTGNLANTGKWVDYQNSYIEIPFVMAMKSSTDISVAANPYMMGLKDGSIQLVDSIILQYNGTSMVQQSIFTNAMQHFKILSSWTQEDLMKWGPATVLSPDDPTGARFSNGVASGDGDGTTNNRPWPAEFTPTLASSIGTHNKGYYERLKCTAYTGSSNGLAVNDASSMGQVGRNFYAATSAAADAKVYYWQVLLTLRLKDMSDFFNKMPILKAARVDLTINFNSFNGTISYTGPRETGAAPATMVSASFNQTAGHSCPFMVSSAFSTDNVLKLEPNSAIVPTATGGAAATAAVLTVGCGINNILGVSALSGVSASSMNNCRWYVPLYEANPEYEQQLYAENPAKTIFYDDFYTYTSITNQDGTFSQLITSGVKNPKYLVLMPFFNNAVANSGNAVNSACYQSFFDTAPATTSPITLTNFQVQVGGKTLFPLVQQYSFQQFLDEFTSIFAYNGGKSPLMTSGLYSKTAWENAPIYVADLSRRLPADDGSPKSIQISATIASKSGSGGTCRADIVAFVVYQRSCTFNLINGRITNAT